MQSEAGADRVVCIWLECRLFKEDGGSDVLMAVWAGNTDTSPLSTQNLSVLLGGRGNKHLVFCELRIILH